MASKGGHVFHNFPLLLQPLQQTPIYSRGHPILIFMGSEEVVAGIGGGGRSISWMDGCLCGQHPSQVLPHHLDSVCASDKQPMPVVHETQTLFYYNTTPLQNNLPKILGPSSFMNYAHTTQPPSLLGVFIFR